MGRLGGYIISFFDYNRPIWFQAVIVGQVFLEKNLNFNMSGETSICILSHKTFWDFSQSGTLPGKVNMEASPNICSRNSFWATSLYALEVHRQFQRQKLSNWICSRVKLKSEELLIEIFLSMILNYMWNWNFSEVDILALNVCSVNLHAYDLI